MTKKTTKLRSRDKSVFKIEIVKVRVKTLSKQLTNLQKEMGQ